MIHFFLNSILKRFRNCTTKKWELQQILVSPLPSCVHTTPLLSRGFSYYDGQWYIGIIISPSPWFMLRFSSSIMHSMDFDKGVIDTHCDVIQSSCTILKLSVLYLFIPTYLPPSLMPSDLFTVFTVVTLNIPWLDLYNIEQWFSVFLVL